MSSSSLQRLRARLALVAFFRRMFGVQDPTNEEDVQDFYDQVASLPEGYNAEGRSYVSNLIGLRIDRELLSEEQLITYDGNVKVHTESLNEHRSDPIELRSFQILAALMAEAYLDRLTRDREGFRRELNEFVMHQNEEHKGRVTFPEFQPGDLSKIAFWMATGSGKTLLLHLNYYQYLSYAQNHGELPENILLVTPNEGLSRQHIAAMRESGIRCRHFNADTVDLWGSGRHLVKVIEIQKLVEEKTGSGQSIEVEAFEGRNLVFVDEGHKGTGSQAQTWRNRRQAIAEQGFTFEYSATFGQALAGAGASIEEEYGKAILFDYSYPRFHSDGYGKEYQILNLENALDTDTRDLYLLANLLTYYEQVHVFSQSSDVYRGVYNVQRPLLVFIGHSVNATTPSDLGVNDKRSLSDVEDVLLFLQRVLRNEDGWVPDAIDRLLGGEATLSDGRGGDLFADSHRTLRAAKLDGTEIFEDLLEKVFHTDGTASVDLINIKREDGEIGLRASNSDQYFGLINIGGDAVFLDRVGEHPGLSVEDDEFTDTLFHEINRQSSPVNVLLGSRKFIEGWDSWRVSTMGLMNFGRGEGPQVIQLFGRGVRLLGKDRSLKRSSDLPGDHPPDLPVLERLNIFGVRADYMAQFRDYLSEEGIETTSRLTWTIPTEIQDSLVDRGLYTVRARTAQTFEAEVNLRLEADGQIKPEIDLLPQLQRITSDEEQDSEQEAAPRHPQAISKELVPLLDWDRIYADIWKFRESRGYTNLVVERDTLRGILTEELYTLYCRSSLITPDRFEDLETVRRVAVMVLQKFVEEFYTRRRRRWEQDQLAYEPLETDEGEDGNLLRSYTAKIRADADDLIEQLEAQIESGALYEGEEGLPRRVHFDRHLYLPLLIEESSVARDKIDYSPPALNKGERALVEELREFVGTEEGASVLESWELFLLRNQSRGRGVGFLTGEGHDDRFYPDFILWMRADDAQHIIFLEPHGLALEGDPLTNHRVRFHKTIKEYEAQLQGTTDSRILLHSYVISQTEYPKLRSRSRADQREEFHERGIYFPEDGIQPLIEDVLTHAPETHPDAGKTG